MILKDLFQRSEPVIIKNVRQHFITETPFFKTFKDSITTTGKEQNLYLKDHFLPHLENSEKLKEYFSGMFTRFKTITVQNFFSQSSSTSCEGFINSSFKTLISEEFMSEIEALRIAGRLHDYNSRIFLGKNGHISKLHFDWKAQNNILIQLEGKKKVRLYHPRKSSDLGFVGNMSEQSNLRPDFEAYLSKGDVLIIPAYWWHEIECVEDSVSLSFRGFTDGRLGFLTDNYPPSWKLLERFSSLIDKESETQDFFKILTIHDQHFINGLDHYTSQIPSRDDKAYSVWHDGYKQFVLNNHNQRQKHIQDLNKEPYTKIATYPLHFARTMF